MTTVVKSVRFDAAHILTNHKGLCKNLHGHTYRVDVAVSRPDTMDGDMVMDFKELKRIAVETVCDRFDHAFIYNTSSPGEMEIAAVVEKNGMKTAPIPFRSTAENLARLFFDELEKKISGVSSVRVWETADSSAEYRR
ncbi:MAG: 6-carboxytetrahydropterin synthase QueD [Kiritimatiellae bacterium]|nr:6-carboxytetrahydropterin synthase QueD [Kiritimatiellia bacterium]